MLELIQIFVNNIVPILLIAAVGFVMGRRLNVPAQPVSRLIFFVFSPSLVFYQLYTGGIGGGEIARLYFGTVLFQFIMAGVALVAVRLQPNMSAVERANVVLASFCLNAGNYGLSLVSFAFGPEVLARAAIVFIASVTMNYGLGVYVASNGRGSPLDALRNLLRTPALYAVVIGFALNTLQIELPLALDRSVESLSNAAIPLMLVMLGLQLSQTTRIDRLRLVGTGVTLKLLLAPFVALGLGLLFGFDDLALTAFVVQGSMPTAVLTIILSTEFDIDRELSANMVLFSTLISPITLSIIIALFQ